MTALLKYMLLCIALFQKQVTRDQMDVYHPIEEQKISGDVREEMQ